MADNPPAAAEGSKSAGGAGLAPATALSSVPAPATPAVEKRLRPAPTAASMPLELRLRALEARVVGVPSSQVSRADLPIAEGETLARRVRAVEEAIKEAVSHTPEFQQLYDRYNRYAPFLRIGLDDPPTSTSPAEGEEDGDEGSAPSARHAVPRDLLPPHAKLAMVLAAAGDLVDADRGLREIDVLNRRDVAGAGNLEDIVALAPALDKGAARVAARRRTLAQTRADAAALVEQYTEFTTTVSDMFVELHEQITAIEERVARAERRRRTQLAERY